MRPHSICFSLLDSFHFSIMPFKIYPCCTKGKTSSLLWLNNTALYSMYVTFSLSVHLRMDTQEVSISWLSPFSLDEYPKVEFLDHMVVLFFYVQICIVNDPSPKKCILLFACSSVHYTNGWPWRFSMGRTLCRALCRVFQRGAHTVTLREMPLFSLFLNEQSKYAEV